MTSRHSKHSDRHVYEGPNSTITFENTRRTRLRFIHAGNTDDSAAGVSRSKVDGEDSMTGSLTNGDAKAGKIAKAGKYKLTST